MSRLKFLPAQLLALLAASSLGAQQTPRDSVRKFYKGLDFGSEAQFNPLTEVLNEGFDMLRIENAERRLGYLQALRRRVHRSPRIAAGVSRGEGFA